MNKKEELLAKIEEIKKEIKKEEEKEALSAHIPADRKEVAELLHKATCHHNHTDGCGWLYDDGSWSEQSRKQFLRKAEVLLRRFSKEDCVYFVQALSIY